MSDQKTGFTLNDLEGQPKHLTRTGRVESVLVERGLRDLQYRGAVSQALCKGLMAMLSGFWVPGAVGREERRFRTAQRA